MRSVKGARALASGMLVLAAICAVPAISAAQDVGTTTDTTAATTTPTTTTTAATPDPVAPATDPTTTTSSSAPPPVSVSGPSRKAHSSASTSVTMGDYFFSAAAVTVSVGDTVTWHNSGQAPHNATGNNGTFSTGTIDPGSSASHTFNSAGTFSYICTIHPNMTGTVRVLSSSSGGGGGGASSSGSGTSESSAVASPDAAGTSTTLPMTGMAVGALALVGAALLASGLIVRRANDKPRRRWLSIF